jgi:hypothetical protein
MSNGNEFERLFKLWASVAKLVVDGKRSAPYVANTLQKIVGESEIHFSSFFFRTRPGLRVSDDFRNQVVAKAEPSQPVPKKSTMLQRDMLDKEIEKMLGEGHLFTEGQVCSIIGDMIGKQEGGKEGELLNNGYANLFYLSSCVVDVSWNSDGREWDVRTWHRAGIRWSAGLRAFSCN